MRACVHGCVHRCVHGCVRAEELDGGCGSGENVVNTVLMYEPPQFKKKLTYKRPWQCKKLAVISSPVLHATKQACSEKPKLKEPGEAGTMLMSHKSLIVDLTSLSLLALWEPG